MIKLLNKFNDYFSWIVIGVLLFPFSIVLFKMLSQQLAYSIFWAFLFGWVLMDTFKDKPSFCGAYFPENKYIRSLIYLVALAVTVKAILNEANLI